MPEKEDVKRIITAKISELSYENATGDLKEDADLIGDGIIDSMGFLTLAATVQKKLGIVIPFDKYLPEEFTVLGKFIEICEREFNKVR